MDRPEWIDVLDSKKEVYVTLTNNSRPRAPATNPPVDAANPRAVERLRPHRPLALRQRLHRPDLLLGHLRPRRRPGRSRRTARPSSATSTARPTASTSHRAGGMWIQTDVSSLDDRRGRLRRVRQQPDAVRRPEDQGDPPLPGRPEGVRDHRRVRRRPTRRRCSSASSTPARRRAATTTPPTRSSTARGPTARRRPAPLVAARHHQGRRRRDRHVPPGGSGATTRVTA